MSAGYKPTRFVLIALFSLALTTGEAFCQQKTSYYDTSMYQPMPEGLNINLRIAAASNYVREINRLVKLGADINHQDNLGLTALTYAVANNNISSVIALLSFDPKTDLFTYEGETNLHIATKLNSVDAVEWLLRKEADINIQDRYKCTALHYASIYNLLYLTDLLIYYGAEPNIQSKDGTTPLAAAVWAGNAEIADILIQAGADISLADKNGYTPLLIAAQNGDTLITKLLLEAGASTTEKNSSNFDIASIAAQTGDIEYAKYIVSNTEWNNKHDKNSVNPLLVARNYGKNGFYKYWSSTGNNKKAGPGFSIIKASAGFKFCLHDFYSAFDLSLIDPLYKLRINIGFDFKPFATRVLYKEKDNLFYQYRDKRYVFKAGLGKEFILSDNIFRGKTSLILNLNMGYMLAETYEGTYTKPEEKLLFLPGLSYERTINKLAIGISYEYMNTGLYKAGPHWIKLSAAYKLRLQNIQSSTKKINWF